MIFSNTEGRNNTISVADRVAFSKQAGADLFISLHANAGGGQLTLHGAGGRFIAPIVFIIVLIGN